MKRSISKENLVMDRIYEKDRTIYRQEFQRSLQAPGTRTFDVRYVVPNVGPQWYRVFVMSIGD